MNLITLLAILEAKLERTTVNYQGETVISYKGEITKVTVNSEDEYTEVYQLMLTHNTDTVILHINHHKNNHTTDYNLSNITNLVIT